jgi:hypothetical protein
MAYCPPQLPENWRDLLAEARTVGYPHSPKHQWAYRNFIRQCFPDADTTNPDIRNELEAWWVLTQLPRDGVWQYWLTAPAHAPDDEGDA